MLRNTTLVLPQKIKCVVCYGIYSPKGSERAFIMGEQYI
jgi:hypothetical protein